MSLNKQQGLFRTSYDYNPVSYRSELKAVSNLIIHYGYYGSHTPINSKSCIYPVTDQYSINTNR